MTLSFDPDPAHDANLQHMGLALDQAQLAYAALEVPIGAVVLHPERGVIGQGHNRREELQDPTAHAEMIAIAEAARALGSWRLEECALYVTLEPCPMCAGAIVLARLPFVYYGCVDPKAGACHTLYQITSDARLNHRCRVVAGVRAEEAASLLRRFFQERRLEGKK